MRDCHLHVLDHIPDLLDIASRHPRYRFLLDSAAPGPLGRYSLLLRASDRHLRLATGRDANQPGFLARLGEWYEEERVSPDPALDLPFCGGWFLYLGYELAGEIEPVLDLPAAPGRLPVALAVRCEGAVIVEHGARPRAVLVAENADLLAQMQQELITGRPAVPADTPGIEGRLEADPDAPFVDAVLRIQQYLEAGDVFQVNISRGWHGTLNAEPDPFALYRALRLANPAPFAGLMAWEGQVLMSSSPERLVEVRGELVQTRPIAGTYPRGRDAESDIALSRDLLAHPKERAEHIMLIDLERNDLGRVCRTGTVEVSELMVVETYAHVHHIVSNIRGQLRDSASPAEVIAAVFPGGTITGCPKVRCMQIIAELEGQGRGFYTGSMGYLSRDGQMDLNILIRSMLIDGREVSLRTGAGIVTDSEPERELAETRAKARGLLLAMGGADD